MRLNSNLVKMHIAKLRMTQADFASVAGLSRQGLNNILVKQTCHPDSLLKIADALGLDPEELIREEA